MISRKKPEIFNGHLLVPQHCDRNNWNLSHNPAQQPVDQESEECTCSDWLSWKSGHPRHAVMSILLAHNIGPWRYHHYIA
jgi:hypothetical protein